MKTPVIAIVIAIISFLVSAAVGVVAFRAMNSAKGSSEFCQKLQNESIAKYQNEINALGNRIATLESGVKILQTVKIPDPKTILELQNQIPEIRKEIVSVQTRTDIGDEAAFTQLTDATRILLARCDQLENELKEELSKLNQNFAKTAGRVASLDQQMLEANERIEAVRGAIGKVSEQAKENKDKIVNISTQLQTEVSRLNGEVSKLNGETSRLDEENRLMYYNYDAVLEIQKREAAKNSLPKEADPVAPVTIDPSKDVPDETTVLPEPTETSEEEPVRKSGFFRRFLSVVTFGLVKR